MAKDPAFLFYSSDFLSGITDLTMEERGQYITLLCVQHQKGVLTEKTIRLLVGSVSVDVLSKFILDDNGNYYNERLKEESEKRKKFTESRRNNGNKGGRPKKNEVKNKNLMDNHMDNHMENHMENENDNVDIIKNSPLNKKEIPIFENFKIYALEQKPNIDEFHLKAKYDSWVEDGWKDGNGNKIKNWKTKLKNTLPYLKENNNKNLQNEQLTKYANGLRNSNQKI